MPGFAKWDIRHPFSSKRPKLLLVEGEDEWHLLIRLLPLIGVEGIDVRSFGGNSMLRPALEALGAGAVTGFDYIKALGIWRDAEQDATAARQSIMGALQAGGFPVPEEVSLFAGTDRRVGYHILPDGASEGCFEDVCLACVAADPATSCVNAYIGCLENQAAEGKLRLDPNRSKTRIHAFLASREDATIQIGQALDARCWDTGHPAWQPLIQFLRDM